MDPQTSATLQIISELQALSKTEQMNAWANLPPEAKASVETLWPQVQGYTGTDAFRAGGRQGMTANAADEIGGFFRKLPGGETQDEYLARTRGENEALQTLYPKSYLGGEATGAVASTAVPVAGWLTGPARAAKAVSTLGKVASVATRGGIWGGVDAAVRGFNAGEGGPGPRVASAVEDLPTGIVAGATLAPIAGGFLGMVGRRMGNSARVAVENNLRKLAESEGVPMSEIVARVEAGEVIAGMNDTTRSAARAIKGLNPKAGQAMLQTALARRTGAQEIALGTAERELVGPTRSAAENLYAEGTEGLRGATRAADETLSSTLRAAGDVSPALQGELELALRTNPDVGRKLRTTLQSRPGVAPLFDPKGSLARTPSIEEANLVFRQLRDTTTSLYQGEGINTARAEATQATYQRLRDMIDAEAAGVAEARAGSAAAKQAEKQGFPLGREFLTTQPEPFARNPVKAVEAPGFLDLGPAGREAAKLGAATALRGRASATGTGNNLMTAMLDENLGGMNLRTMVGAEGMGRIGPTVQAAREEHQLVDALIGGSNTADKLAAQAALKRGPSLPGQLAETAEEGVTAMALKALRHIVGGADDLTDEELWELGKLMMSAGPEGAKAVRAAVAGDGVAAATVRGTIRDLKRNAGDSIFGRRGGMALTIPLATDEEPRQGLNGLLDMMGAPR